MNILLSRTPKHLLTMIVDYWIISFAYSLGERIWHKETPAALNGDHDQIVIFRSWCSTLWRIKSRSKHNSILEER